MTPLTKTITVTRRLSSQVFFINRPDVESMAFPIINNDVFKSCKKALIELGIAEDIQTLQIKRKLSNSIDYKVVFMPTTTSQHTH